ncbi:MAG TPA: hypothetical protein VFZ78_07015 [Flavisolibacter sp.]
MRLIQRDNTNIMELKAVVAYDGGVAHYSVSPESTGLYQARLEKYEGSGDRTPPEELILVRGVRHWSGSTEQQVLLDELGRAIESREREDHPSGPAHTGPGDRIPG